MSTARVRRTRPAARRARPAAAAQVEHDPYRKYRAAVALMLFVLVFGLLWLINGAWTAGFVMEKWKTDSVMGWSVHLIISAIELAAVFVRPYFKGAPWYIMAVIILISVPFGVLDVYSGALGIQFWLEWTGLEGIAMYVQNTLLAMAVAFLPERMIVWLLIGLQRVLRS